MKRQHILRAGEEAPSDLKKKLIVADTLPVQHIQSANTPRFNSRRGHFRLRLSQPP